MGARLHIIHVIDPVVLVDSAASGGGAWTAMLPALQESARLIVGLTVREAEDAHVPHTVRVLEGFDAPAGIVKEAEAVGAELIVVGSHGRTGLRRALIGSVAERVVRAAHCPVLVYR
jgi:nucleotide-binding universal stress UspA family protein